MSRESTVLDLVVRRVWFEEIASGRKKIEYREMNSFWQKRLFHPLGIPIEYDFVRFRQGYEKTSPRIYAKFEGVEIVNLTEELIGEIRRKDRKSPKDIAKFIGVEVYGIKLGKLYQNI